MNMQPDLFMILVSFWRCTTALHTNSVDSLMESISLVKSFTSSLFMTPCLKNSVLTAADEMFTISPEFRG